MSETDRERLAACRACGNRVTRGARRCPACGTREPTADVPDRAEPAAPEAPPAAPREAPFVSARPPAGESLFTPPPAGGAAGGSSSQAPRRQAARRRRRAFLVVLSLVLALTVAGVAALYVSAPVDAPPLPRRPEAAAPAPDVTPAPASPGAVEPSRSRGRSEWLFFFKPGDWVTRMTDDALLGVVVRVEKSHTFADGSHGPAYTVQSMEGEERIVDADELERTARVR